MVSYMKRSQICQNEVVGLKQVYLIGRRVAGRVEVPRRRLDREGAPHRFRGNTRARYPGPLRDAQPEVAVRAGAVADPARFGFGSDQEVKRAILRGWA